MHDDDTSVFETLRGRDHTYSINHKNMPCLRVKVFKVAHGLTDNEILKYFNNSTTNYNLGLQADLKVL